MSQRSCSDRGGRHLALMTIAGRTFAACTVYAQPAQEKRDSSPTEGELDLYQQYKEEYVAPENPVVIDVGEAQYLTVAGKGEPGGPAFVAAVGALYGAAYSLKMKSKIAGRDYTVAPLEGLWWGTKSKHDFFGEPRDTWNWKLLIRTPEFITDRDVQAAVKPRPDNGNSAMANEVRLETIGEGRCVQMLHVGPYTTEIETLNQMTGFMQKKGLTRNGVHHEIYLSDPSKTAPEKLRTILRVPVK